MRNLEKKGRNLKRRYFSGKKNENFFKAVGGGWTGEGVLTDDGKISVPKKKVKTRSERPAAPATCVSVVQKRPVERGPRGAEFFLFGTVGCIFPKVKVECVCVCLTFLLFGNVKSFISGPFVLHSAGDLVSTFSELKT